VYILRNPDTVEARIWDLLSSKLERIQQALSQVMDEQEDIGQLVVGMTGASFFEHLFAEGQTRPKERLSEWFDQKAATIDGEDVVDRVKAMLGQVSRFDFAQVGRNLPQVDLPDLERFLSMMLERMGRRVLKREDGLEIKTPQDWLDDDYTLQDRYQDLVFDRTIKAGRASANRVVGIGHRLFDTSLKHAENLTGALAICARLDQPLLIMSVEDEVTGQGHAFHRLIVGAFCAPTGEAIILRDWELLRQLNQLGRSDTRATPSIDRERLADIEQALIHAAKEKIGEIADMMTRPQIRSEIMLVPEKVS
jgi:hypothetical protein